MDTSNDKMKGSYLGPTYSNNEIKQSLENLGAKFCILSDEDLINKTSGDLVNGHAICCEGHAFHALTPIPNSIRWKN